MVHLLVCFDFEGQTHVAETGTWRKGHFSPNDWPKGGQRYATHDPNGDDSPAAPAAPAERPVVRPVARNLGNYRGTGEMVPYASRTLNGEWSSQHFCPFGVSCLAVPSAWLGTSVPVCPPSPKIPADGPHGHIPFQRHHRLNNHAGSATHLGAVSLYPEPRRRIGPSRSTADATEAGRQHRRSDAETHQTPPSLPVSCL